MENRISGLLDFKKLKGIFDKNPVLISICIVAILIAASIYLFGGSRDTPEQTNTNEINISDFTENTEMKIKDILEKIEGVGNCEVMLSIENGVEYIYATEQSVNNNTVTDSDDTYKKDETQIDEEKRLIIINDASGGEKALVTKEIQPKIQGVAVICDGASSVTVKSRVIETITTVLNISSDKVCVIEKQ